VRACIHAVSSKTLDQTRERVALEQHTFCPVQSRRCRCHRRRSCCGRWSQRSRARRSDFTHHNMSRASTQEGRSSERVSSEWTSECSGSQRACSFASFMFAAPQSHARKGAIYSRQRRQSAGAAIRAAPLCEGPRMAVRVRSNRVHAAINACCMQRLASKGSRTALFYARGQVGIDTHRSRKAVIGLRGMVASHWHRRQRQSDPLRAAR
jgi:hypothetical protein